MCRDNHPRAKTASTQKPWPLEIPACQIMAEERLQNGLSISNRKLLLLFLHSWIDGTPQFPNWGNLVGADWFGNLRWDHTEPYVPFSWVHMEPSMYFRKANTKPSTHFKEAFTEPSMYFRIDEGSDDGWYYGLARSFKIRSTALAVLFYRCCCRDSVAFFFVCSDPLPLELEDKHMPG